MQKLKTSTCDHSDSDRCLEGVWCTPEIVEALNAGYKIVTIHEVWHWEQRSSELFQGYINTFLKIKQEASGYPSWARTDTEKANYIEKYFEHEQIKLDASKINKNNGLRKISKLLLNTLWGRFGMNLNKSKIKVLTERETWYEMLADDNFVIQNVLSENPEIIQVVYTELNETHQGGNQTNVPIAAFVTTYARLKLYRTLTVLDKRVLYFDTDSIIFVSDSAFAKTEHYPKLGDFLGDWTDECGGRYIKEFVASGPKCYSLLYSDGEAKCVCKGFQQTCLANEVITFDSMKELVIDDNEKQLLVPQSRIQIDRSQWKLTTTYTDKKFNFVYDKRVLTSDFFTYPFGY